MDNRNGYELLQEKLEGVTDLDEIVRICTEAGFPVTRAQLEADRSKDDNEELSEDDLSCVVGGVSNGILGQNNVLMYLWKIWKKRT